MNEQNPNPIIKITIDSAILASLLRSAADSVQAASAAGMKVITMRHDMTVREFLRFCLGEAGRLDDGN